MTRKIVALLSLLICPLSVAASPPDDEPMLVLSMQIFSDGEKVSEPRIAVTPGSDASVMQGVEDDLVLKVVFHSVHVGEDGAEMLVDVDFGVNDPEHLMANHVVMPWNEAYEMVFAPALDSPSFRFLITPSRATRGDFLLRNRAADQD